jgi:ABC-type transport system substrate-binding protein
MNITEAKGYLAEDAIHVDSDYKITFNLDYSYVPIIHTLIRQTGCAISPKAVIDNIPSTFMTDGNNDTGMINLADWFPALNGNYTKLGLALNADSKKSGVIPSGIVDEGSPSQHTWFKDHMVGTGPWILSNKTQFLIELNRNENWWNKEKFAPNAPNKIVLKAVADPTLRAESFTNGDADRAEIDYTLIDQFSFPNGSTKKDTIKAYKFDKINVDFFGFNLRNGSELGDGYINMFETSKSWWNNNSALIAAGFVGYEHLPKSPEVSNPFTVLKFRKAFSLAFNYSAYSDKVLNGFANRMEGLIPKGLLGHQDNLIEQGYIPEFDVESAKMLFEELGWRGTITIPYNDGSTARKSIALMLKQTIESMNVGINIVASEMNWATFLMQFYKTPLFFLGWNPDIPDPDNYITSFVHSIKGYYSSRIQYINPNLDPMLSEASSELDPSQRSVLYANLEKYIAEEGIFIYAAQQYEISRIWYQWNGLEESGSLNPMRFFPRAHLMEKVEQEKIPVGQIVTITAPTKTISSLSFPTSSTAPNTSTISINSSVQPSSTSDKNIITSTDLSGFELVSIAGMFVVGAILYKRRK